LVEGQPGDVHTNVVSATGTDDDGAPVADTDDATVTFTSVASAIDVVKTADPTSVDAPGAEVTFSVVIANLSETDAVTITNLSDDIHGDLNGQGDCSVPQIIAVEGTYSCSFTVFVGGSDGSETDIVTASGVDDDGNPVSDSDDATVLIVPEVVEDIDLSVEKTGPASSVAEGDSVAYTITVTNHGPLTEPNAVAVDTMPDTFLFVSVQTSQGTCSESSGVITCQLGELAPGDSAIIIVVAETTRFGNYINSVVVDGEVADRDTANNRAEAPASVTRTLPQIITTTTSTPPGTLPVTGARTGGPGGVGIAMLLLGALALLVARRREDGIEEGSAL
jgi:uncharacterized repeat protein (TIGR01451 family)/LPXTG-motif cell wall-anchored protein